VTVHSEGLDRREFIKMLPILYAEGIGTLFFDSREHGISSGSYLGPSYGIREYKDISYMVAYLKKKWRYTKVVVMGISQGAVAAIKAASIDPNISAVIAEEPFVTVEEGLSLLAEATVKQTSDVLKYVLPNERLLWWLPSISDYLPYWFYHITSKIACYRLSTETKEEDRFEAIDAIKNVEQPTMFIHGTNDKVIPTSHSQRLYDASPAKIKHLWFPEGGLHGEAYNNNPTEWRNEVMDFLRTACRRRSS